jgi:RNA polymerase sigma factor (sigma-70 family)
VPTNDVFRKIMEQHTERLIRVAYYYTKDLQTAEDLVQDVFIKFYHKQRDLKDVEDVSAYLTRMTINRCKDYLKSWHVRKVRFQQKWVEQVEKEELTRFVQQDEEQIIGEAIMRLSLKHREVLVYYYFEEMTIPSIAQLLQIPQSTVKTRLVRGRELLKAELQGIEWEVLLHE